MDKMMRKIQQKKLGRVYLVGAGPGDPKLLTVRGQELLQQADLVVYDHLVSQRLLQQCRANARFVYVGKEADKQHTNQRSINALLVRAAKAGKMVVRLKGGDPCLFGRGGEEALALAEAHIQFEIVPGVSSASAVPAYAGIPLTHRGLSSSVAIITGHEDPEKVASNLRWEQLANAADTLVCLMGGATLPKIVTQLRRYGRSHRTPCAVIEWGTYPRQRTVVGTLQTIVARAKTVAIEPPAILLVGDVVKLRAHLNWFETKPLFGKRILVTRSQEKSASLTEQLETRGAEVEELPAIELAPVKPSGLFHDAVKAIPSTDWIFFTSPEGLGWFTRMLKPHRKDLRWLSGCHVGAIGPKTAATIEEAGLHVDFMPKRYSQEGMLAELPKRMLVGKRALIFSAEGSRELLERGLRERGMHVTKVPIYRTVVPKALMKGISTIFQRPFDAVTVTSASCVEHLHHALQASGHGKLFSTLRFASIGPVTSRAVRAHGGRVMVKAATSTIEGLVEALQRRWR